MIIAISAILIFGTTQVKAIQQDETLTWGELILEIKQDKEFKQKITDLVENEFNTSNLYSNPKTNKSLFDEFCKGIIQDSISAHLMANIIKQKAQRTSGSVFLNPEDTSIQKNASIESIESVITKNLVLFCKMWQTLTNRKIKPSTETAINVLNSCIIPAIKERLVLIINIANEILADEDISNGYAKIYGHIYKNAPDKNKSKDMVIDDLAKDLADIFATYYYETKKPENVVLFDVLHMFHFSWMRDIYLPAVRLRKTSTLFKENSSQISAKKRQSKHKSKKRKKSLKNKELHLN
jgi:hypothetical protein